jgi:hypothetical protein
MNETGPAPAAPDDPGRVTFFVDDVVYCVVGFDLAGVQSKFVSRIDPDIFGSTADTLVRRLERGKLGERGAVLLRMAYLHALETALALTFAAVQAPSAVPAWLRLYRILDIQSLASKALTARPIDGGWVRKLSGCREIAAQLMGRMPDPLTASSGALIPRSACIDGFARALRHMSEEFLDEPTRQEYNDLKHGFRVSPGGFRLAIREECGELDTPKARPAVLLADSAFGSSSWALERVSGEKHLLRYVEVSRNWDPAATAQKMQVVAAWIANVKSGLAVAAGATGPDVKWVWFADPAAYETPWVPQQPTRSMSWRSGEFAFADPPSRDALAEEHRRAREAAERRGS